jgi:Nif-specific regulatory protein
MKVLSSCYWPGNVRELENCIERTATMLQGDMLRDVGFGCKQNRCLTQTLHSLDKDDAVAAVRTPLSVISMPSGRAWPGGSVPAATSGVAQTDPYAGPEAADTPPGPDGVTVIGPTRHLPPRPVAAPAAEPQGERERLIWAMEQCGWVQAKAARLLRLTPRQMGYALQKNLIEIRKF